ncbi:MAG: hypothetical protein IPG72_14265 [Ardenticatenales bacterium]|jgi:Na+/H+ antiporter NhaC|nr:hypothetical protein [Ardenticatenales bacterium]
MPDAAASVATIDLALAAAASLAWAVGLLMALPRHRAFRQRRDLWWALTFACLLIVGIGQAFEAWAGRGGDPAGDAALLHVGTRIAFALAGVAAVQGYRRRIDAFD